MARYFFNLTGDRAWIDKEGVELPDLSAAKAEAVRYFGETLRDHADAFTGSDEWEVDVRDEDGRTLMIFFFLMAESAAGSKGSRSSATPRHLN